MSIFSLIDSSMSVICLVAPNEKTRVSVDSSEGFCIISILVISASQRQRHFIFFISYRSLCRHFFNCAFAVTWFHFQPFPVAAWNNNNLTDDQITVEPTDATPIKRDTITRRSHGDEVFYFIFQHVSDGGWIRLVQFLKNFLIPHHQKRAIGNLPRRTPILLTLIKPTSVCFSAHHNQTIDSFTATFIFSFWLFQCLDLRLTGKNYYQLEFTLLNWHLYLLFWITNSNKNFKNTMIQSKRCLLSKNGFRYCTCFLFIRRVCISWLSLVIKFGVTGESSCWDHLL